MSQQTITPVHHGLVSTTATAAAGAGIGGIKGLLAGGAIGFLAPVAIGALLLGGVGALFGLTGLAIGAGLGIFAGGGVGLFTTGLGAGVGTLFGGFKGASRGLERVAEEKGAANMLDAQLSAYQAQAIAAQQATTIYAPSAANNNYATASTLNRAGTQVQADSAQNLGTINGQQLQRA